VTGIVKGYRDVFDEARLKNLQINRSSLLRGNHRAYKLAKYNWGRLWIKQHRRQLEGEAGAGSGG